jgi:WD40 repeat protein
MQLDRSFDFQGEFYGNRMPLKSNGNSIKVIQEHQGLVFFSKFNPTKRILATGGAGDCFVNLWDFNHSPNAPWL